jgi:hypothetical protein
MALMSRYLLDKEKKLTAYAFKFGAIYIFISFLVLNYLIDIVKAHKARPISTSICTGPKGLGFGVT